MRQVINKEAIMAENDPNEGLLHCDYCTKVEYADDLTPDWNGETGNHLSCEARVATGRQRVLNEITEDIDSGNAHLMTRNELVEFMSWWANGPEVVDNPRVVTVLDVYDDANSMIAEAMDEGRDLDLVRRERVAKAFFIEKGYE